MARLVLVDNRALRQLNPKFVTVAQTASAEILGADPKGRYDSPTHLGQQNMSRTGRCYCGEVQYESVGDPVMQAQCHCRECQYLTGGSANVFMAVPEDGLTFTQSDIDGAVTREFRANCGTHLLTRAPGLPGAVVLKAGTLDDPGECKPQIAIFTCDQQPFQTIPEGVAAF